MASRTPNQVSQLYEKVIQDVITNVRDSFLDDGVDEQVLMELKQIWEAKLSQTKAVDTPTIGDRVRPTYSYSAMTAPKAPVLYQVPAGAVHFSAASQQARAGMPNIIYQRSGNIVLPTTNKVFSSYQPAVASLRQPVTQQLMPGGETIVLASSSNVPKQSSNKPGSSNVVQVDGSSDEPESGRESRKVSVISKCGSSGALKKQFPKRKLPRKVFLQVDGKGDSSSSDDELGDDDEDDDDDDDDAEDDETEESQEKDTEDEEPLNSDDDDSDEEGAGELFDVENVVVCQYDKIHRAKAKWKFNLKVGIMNLEGKDHVFLKANGEADW